VMQEIERTPREVVAEPARHRDMRARARMAWPCGVHSASGDSSTATWAVWVGDDWPARHTQRAPQRLPARTERMASRRRRAGPALCATASYLVEAGVSSALAKLPNGCPFRWGTVGGWGPTRLLLVMRFWVMWGVR